MNIPAIFWLQREANNILYFYIQTCSFLSGDFLSANCHVNKYPVSLSQGIKRNPLSKYIWIIRKKMHAYPFTALLPQILLQLGIKSFFSASKKL